MEIKRASTQKPKFCDDKKPIVKKNKKKKKSSKRVPPVNKVRQTAYVSDLEDSCPACHGPLHTIDRKEVVRIIEEEAGKHNLLMKGE